MIMLKKIEKIIKKKFNDGSNRKDSDFHDIVKEYRELYNQKIKDWFIYHQKQIVFNRVSWFGVTIYKNPFDLWIYQEIIFNSKPDIIIEIGSAHGGSTLYLANILDLLGRGQVISLDIERSNYSIKHKRIIDITGDCLSQAIVDNVFELCKNKTVMIIHDGDHHFEHVLKCLKLYSPLVSINNYFIVEDGVIDLFYANDGIGGHEGPLKATVHFIESNSNFIFDSSCERYQITYNPKGFLKRIK
jgi:cephalosporin hydroxylase